MKLQTGQLAKPTIQYHTRHKNMHMDKHLDTRIPGKAYDNGDPVMRFAVFCMIQKVRE